MQKHTSKLTLHATSGQAAAGLQASPCLSQRGCAIRSTTILVQQCIYTGSRKCPLLSLHAVQAPVDLRQALLREQRICLGKVLASKEALHARQRLMLQCLMAAQVTACDACICFILNREVSRHSHLHAHLLDGALAQTCARYGDRAPWWRCATGGSPILDRLDQE